MLNNFKNKLKEANELYLRIKVNPGMSKTEIKNILNDGTLKINIAAPPEKGKANQALVRFLAGEFEINKNNIKIISGAGDKLKLIKINY